MNALDRSTPGRNRPNRNARDRNARDRNAPDRNAPDRNAPDRNAPDRNAPDRNAPDRNAPDRNAPDRHGPGWTVIMATASLGAAMMILPAFSMTGRSQVITIAGLLLVAASLAGPLARWPGTATLAGVAAVAGSALGHPGIAALAAEGLLVLGYLLLTDAPAAMPWRVAARWLRLQAPAAIWAALASAAVLLVLGIPVPVSAWLVVAGAGAAVAATVIALPRQSRQPREPR